MPKINPPVLQAMFVTFKGQGDRITLHTADPGTDIAASRAPGNLPITTTWPTGSNGTGTGSVCQCAITVSGSAVIVTHAVLSNSSGTHVATYQLPTPARFDYSGTLNVTPTLTVAAA